LLDKKKRVKKEKNSSIEKKIKEMILNSQKTDAKQMQNNSEAN
jgi:hypothetical protein